MNTLNSIMNKSFNTLSFLSPLIKNKSSRKSIRRAYSFKKYIQKRKNNTKSREVEKKEQKEKNNIERIESWETIGTPINEENDDSNDMPEIKPVYTPPEIWQYSRDDEFTNNSMFCKIIGNCVIEETEDSQFVKKYIDKILTTNELSLNDIEEITKFIVDNRGILEQPIFTHITLDNNVIMIGDIHGDLSSMIFQIIVSGGFANGNKFLFLGDYLDRGPNGTECMYLLFLLRFLFPNQMYFLRGNHEDVKICHIYGMASELIKKQCSVIDLQIYFNFFENLFLMMPICADIGGIVFAVHGCISEHTPLENIDNIERVRNMPESSQGYNHIFTNMLWSDPSECNDDTLAQSCYNQRGEGYTVPKYVTNEFLKKYGYSIIVRAHQVANDGYSFQHDDKVLTLFGQPNYCRSVGNLGAYMTIQKSGKTDIVQFTDIDVIEFINNFEIANKEKEKGEESKIGFNIPHYFA
jgi:diadenosine tetraphosphatase ApaH/serine/threonine PP2A family protein phosphatase